MKIESQHRFNIVVVDDMPDNLRILVSILKAQGYKVRPLPSAHLALNAIRNMPPDLILLDIMMPEMDGYEVCRQLKNDEHLKDIPVMFISALSETFDKVKAFQAGGVDYITKPFQVEEVIARVRTHLTLWHLQKQMAHRNHNLQKIVQAQVKEISAGHVAAIAAITKLAEYRDDDTGKHIERTQIFCRLLAENLQHHADLSKEIDEEFINDIYNASPLHDIGKVAIPDAILLKPGNLTVEEFKIMKTHAAIGAEYLAKAAVHLTNNEFIRMGQDIAKCHHEKWDGSGYPDGLEKEQIPLSARIMAVADVYDALRSKRVYKEAFSHEKSCQIIKTSSGTHFDPRLVAAFLELEEKFCTIRNTMNDDNATGKAGTNNE